MRCNSMTELPSINHPVYTSLLKTIFFESSYDKIVKPAEKYDSTIYKELKKLQKHKIINIYDKPKTIKIYYPGIISFIYKTNLKPHLDEATSSLRELNLPKLNFKHKGFNSFLQNRLNQLFSSDVSQYSLRELFELIILKQGSIITHNICTRQINNDIPSTFDWETKALGLDPRTALAQTVIKQEVLKISGLDPQEEENTLTVDIFALFNYLCFVKHARLNKLYK